MRKLIKSGKEIKKEIDDLFLDFKSDSDLLERINSYLEKVTGKELYSISYIKNLIRIKLLLKIGNGKIKPKKNSPIYDKFPELVESSIRKNNAVFNPFLKFFKELDSMTNKSTFLFTTQVHFIESSDAFDQSNNYSSYRFNKKIYLDLVEYLKKNNDISELLYHNLCKTVRESVIDLVIGNIVPLKTLLIFFNIEKDIKQNTQALYELCRRKIPRLNIQQVITDNINSIRNGEFVHPFSDTEIPPFD